MVTNHRAFVIEALVKIQQAGLQIRPQLEHPLLVERALDDRKYWQWARNPTLSVLGSLMFELSDKQKHCDKPWTQGQYGLSAFVNAAALEMPIELKALSRADRKTACLHQLHKLAAMTEGELTFHPVNEKLGWFNEQKTIYSVETTTSELTIRLGAQVSLLAAVIKMNGDLKRHLKGQYVTFPELMDSGGLHIAYVTPAILGAAEALFGKLRIVDDELPWPSDYYATRRLWYPP
jgi:hypothetical protein